MAWADRAAPIVADVIRTVGRADQQALRQALVEAYPWGGTKKRPLQGVAGRGAAAAWAPTECSPHMTRPTPKQTYSINHRKRYQ